MANDTPLTIIGHATSDPELRFTQSGLAVANWTTASTPRKFDKSSNEWKDEESLFLRCSIWREAAEHVAATITKGMKIVVVGNLVQRSFQDKDGNNRTSMELQVTEVGPALSNATAVVTKASVNQNQARNQDRAAGRGQGQQGGGQQGGYPAGQNASQGFPAQQAAGADEPWGVPQNQGTQYDSETPF